MFPLSNLILVFCSSLTAAKEDGATIEIDGKKVALGIPKAQGNASGSGPLAFASIPLRREGSPDEAAAAVLLYVFIPVYRLHCRSLRIFDQSGIALSVVCIWSHVGSYWWWGDLMLGNSSDLVYMNDSILAVCWLCVNLTDRT